MFIENIKKGLNNEEIEELVNFYLKQFSNIKKILIIHPDYTRIDFSHILAPIVCNKLKKIGVQAIHFLCASGTHRNMSQAEKLVKLGLKNNSEHFSFHNHEYDNKDKLVKVGEISKSSVNSKTSGMISAAIPVEVNKLIFSDFDLIIAMSSTVPHESVGYSGGLKTFFPGIAGPEVLDLFHWVAVLIGLPEIIGSFENPAKDIINEGAFYIFKKIKKPIISFNMIIRKDKGRINPTSLFVGEGYYGFRESHTRASITSEKVHTIFTDKPLKRVVQVIPECFDELWTAAKGSYKLQKEGVLEKGSEIIIYAPHIKCLHSNKKMETQLKKVGYHCREFILNKLKSNPDLNKNIASHIINVCGSGEFNLKTGIEKPNYRIKLATGISKEECEEIGLGYYDHKKINKKDFSSVDSLWIEDGGFYLYKLKQD